MTPAAGARDWDPGAYARFRGLRLRPALDLLMRVDDLPAGDIVDLGCGDGAAAETLRNRFPGRRIVGVDSSPAMLGLARGYHLVIQADIATWRPHSRPALIFSNAALHWLPDHATLLPRLAALLAPGGLLAVQMPRQFGAPSHALLRQFAVAMFPDLFDFSTWQAPVAPPAQYLRMLAPLGTVSVWETDYMQRLDPVSPGHPVRMFTESTALRPLVDKLTPAQQADFVAAYDTALATAYPAEPDGTVLFPFRRLFFTLQPG